MTRSDASRPTDPPAQPKNKGSGDCKRLDPKA
jgi:hypothetical protein